jgi:hypothetical protein
MIRNFTVTIKTRIPPPAAFEPQGDDIRFLMPMFAASFGIDVDTENLDPVDVPRHRCCR